MYIRLDRIPDDFQTRLRLIRGIDKPLHLMSVDEICKKCNISRSSFYRLHPTKDHFKFWFLELCCSLALDEIGRSVSWREGLKSHFTLLSQERVFFEYDITHWNTHENEYMISHRRGVIHQTIEEHHKSQVDEELQMQVLAYCCIESRLVGEWLAGKEHIKPEVFAGHLESCVPSRLHAALSLK